MNNVTSVMITLVVGALLYWLGPIVIGWMMRHTVLTPYQRTLHKRDLEKRQKTLINLYQNVWRMFVMFVVIYVICYTIFDKDILAPLFASAGIIGVALGFGAQSLVKDFLSGVFIISENQYRVGDVIEIEGFGGTVERIGFRSTVIRDVDGNVHYFPNGMVQHVINKTMGYSMARFTVNVEPDTDMTKVEKIINKVGLDLAAEEDWKNKILEAPHYVLMSDFTSTSATLVISGKTQPSDQWSVIAEMRQRLLKQFEIDGIKLGLVPTAITQQSKKKK